MTLGQSLSFSLSNSLGGGCKDKTENGGKMLYATSGTNRGEMWDRGIKINYGGSGKCCHRIEFSKQRDLLRWITIA